MTEALNRQWAKCLEIIRDNIGDARTQTWFACAKPLDFDGKTLILGLPSHFYYEKYEDVFLNLLSDTLRKVFGEGVNLEYKIDIINNDASSNVTISSPQQSHTIKNKYVRSMQATPFGESPRNDAPDFDPQLNELLTFENYCVGDSNRLPLTIAEYIANNPGKHDFNPFFLYGDVGVGKTHLIQAIGIRVKERNPKAKVLFVTLRQFQNLYQNATLQKKIPSFLNWFMQLDMLLIDDLQELSGKIGTASDALFPVFNHLHQNGKALVFTCDRPPMELDGIADRLIDRFKWGITERLPKPDFALKKKILQFKARKNGLDIPEDVIDLISSQSSGSVRELEGIVMGLLTRSITLNAPITLQLAQEVMKNSIKKVVEKTVNFDMIVEATADFYKLNPDVIFSKSRVRDIADARQVIMYLCHKLTSLSSSAIGQKLNRRHATVLHGISAIEDRLPFAKDLSIAVETIEEDLRK